MDDDRLQLDVLCHARLCLEQGQNVKHALLMNILPAHGGNFGAAQAAVGK